MDITNVLESVLSIVMTVAFAYLGKAGHDNRKAQELNESLSVAEKYAKDIVITLSQKGDLSNSQKFKEAYIFVVNKLKAQDIHVTAETIENKINSAYQLYKMDGGDIHKFIPDFAKDAVSEVEQAIVTPESRLVQQPTQSVQSTPVQSVPVQSVPEKEETPKEDTPKEEDSIKIDEPKTDAPVSNNNVQSAPVNPYVK